MTLALMHFQSQSKMQMAILWSKHVTSCKNVHFYGFFPFLNGILFTTHLSYVQKKFSSIWMAWAIQWKNFQSVWTTCTIHSEKVCICLNSLGHPFRKIVIFSSVWMAIILSVQRTASPIQTALGMSWKWRSRATSFCCRGFTPSSRKARQPNWITLIGQKCDS